MAQTEWLHLKFKIQNKVNNKVENRWNIISESMFIEKYDSNKYSLMWFCYKNDSVFSYSKNKTSNCIDGWVRTKSEKQSVKLTSEKKVIKGYVARKAILYKTSGSNRFKNVTLWFSEDPRLKKFVQKKDPVVEGVVLETESEQELVILDSIEINTITPSAVNELDKLPRCIPEKLPDEIKPLFDAAIKQAQDEIDGLIEKKEIQ